MLLDITATRSFLSSEKESATHYRKAGSQHFFWQNVYSKVNAFLSAQKLDFGTEQNILVQQSVSDCWFITNGHESFKF